jgi:hypothetical protein
MGVPEFLREALQHGLAEQLFAEMPGTESTATEGRPDALPQSAGSGGGGEVVVRPLKFRQL